MTCQILKVKKALAYLFGEKVKNPLYCRFNVFFFLVKLKFFLPNGQCRIFKLLVLKNKTDNYVVFKKISRLHLSIFMQIRHYG